jgi:cytoskeleton protein RodZ
MIEAPRTLSQLRQERGMSLEALAAQIKVSPAKLIALESGRYDELPNAAFTRSLAMLVCRVLKVDSKPILATLPSPNPVNVVAETTSQLPFKSGQARLNLDTSFMVQVRRLVKLRYVLPLLILAAAIGVYNWPEQAQSTPTTDAMNSSQLAADAAGVSVPVSVEAAAPDVPALPTSDGALAAPFPAPAPLVGSEFAASAVVESSSHQLAAEAPAAISAADVATSKAVEGQQGNLVMRVTDDTWVQVKDASGELLLRRLVLAGERIALTGILPVNVKVGNAKAVELTYQGQRVDLSEHTRANVARIELK